jgi:hypothetical protein
MSDASLPAQTGVGGRSVLDEFWKAAAGKLADRWAAMAAPAVVFWAGAVVAWAYAEQRWSRLSKITDWLNKQHVIAQIAALIGALVIVAASTIIVQRLTDPVLRLLEGYWPRPISGLRIDIALYRRVKADKCWKQLNDEIGDGEPTAAQLAELARLERHRHQRPRRSSRLIEVVRRYALWRKEMDVENWQLLQTEIDDSQPTAAQLAELARLERRRRHRPVLDSELLPTRVGNILRAAETRPRHRYGLDVVLIWPRLWLVLPDTTRKELASARASLDASVAAAIWGTAFVAFTPFTNWALVGLVVTLAAVLWWVPARAEVFADLIEATVELYRIALYRQLRWPLPKNPATEPERGEALTEYLERGSFNPYPVFTPAP